MCMHQKYQFSYQLLSIQYKLIDEFATLCQLTGVCMHAVAKFGTAAILVLEAIVYIVPDPI